MKTLNDQQKSFLKYNEKVNIWASKSKEVGQTSLLLYKAFIGKTHFTMVSNNPLEYAEKIVEWGNKNFKVNEIPDSGNFVYFLPGRSIAFVNYDFLLDKQIDPEKFDSYLMFDDFHLRGEFNIFHFLKRCPDLPMTITTKI